MCTWWKLVGWRHKVWKAEVLSGSERSPTQLNDCMVMVIIECLFLPDIVLRLHTHSHTYMGTQVCTHKLYSFLFKTHNSLFNTHYPHGIVGGSETSTGWPTFLSNNQVIAELSSEIRSPDSKPVWWNQLCDTDKSFHPQLQIPSTFSQASLLVEQLPLSEVRLFLCLLPCLPLLENQFQKKGIVFAVVHLITPGEWSGTHL